MTTRRRALAAASIIAIGIGVTACGSEGISPTVADDQPNIARGADLFAERCAGCHTLDAAGAEGSATKVNNREYKDGPNLNQRTVKTEDVLYAIRNGGFSSGPMPQNILTGEEAQKVADFVAEYSGGGGSE